MNDYFSMQSVPLIRRARGYFLYTPDGRRFLDFYQDNGRAVLGHRSSGMQQVIKSTVSKGCWLLILLSIAEKQKA